MKHQKLQIGHSLECTVYWYDTVPEPPRNEEHEGEVIGWRKTQVIIRVKGYSVLRFWKNSGIEVGNSDHTRRGFKISMLELGALTEPAPGVSVTMIDTDA